MQKWLYEITVGNDDSDKSTVHVAADSVGGADGHAGPPRYEEHQPPVIGLWQYGGVAPHLELVPRHGEVHALGGRDVDARRPGKLFHALGRLKKLKVANPDLRIGVGGCVAQLQGTDILDRAPQVDVLVGTHNVSRVPDLFLESFEAGTRVDLDRK